MILALLMLTVALSSRSSPAWASFANSPSEGSSEFPRSICGLRLCRHFLLTLGSRKLAMRVVVFVEESFFVAVERGRKFLR